MNEINLTIAIIAITCVVSYVGWQNRSLTDQLIFWPPGIKQGQLHRFVTHGFLHADGQHLLFNMFTLYFFGSAVEQVYRIILGPIGFVLFYLLAIVAAMIPSYFQHKNNSQYFSLGASGAVSAVLFTYILLAPWSMLYLFAAIPVPAILFAVAYVWYSIKAHHKNNDNINHMAHLYGALFGVIFTAIIAPRSIPLFFEQLVNPGWF